MLVAYSPDQWLARTTRECPRYARRVPIRDCEGMRGSASCRGCEYDSPQDAMTMAKTRECVLCGRMMKIKGRGLCGRCYEQAIKAERAAKRAAMADAPAERCEALTLPIVDDRDRRLLTALERRAYLSRRTVEAEAMAILEAELCGEPAVVEASGTRARGRAGDPHPSPE